MLQTTKQLHGIVIHAIDGEIGSVNELYFDDDSWAIRYLTVKTGGWLDDRQVLISPFSIKEVDYQGQRLNVALTKEQVKGSPDINTHMPVSRQEEATYLGYYQYPYYWGGPYLWGPAFQPADLATGFVPSYAPLPQAAGVAKDSHLRSTTEVAGYHLEAADGEIGHVDGFLFDDDAWAIRYLEIATRNWWPGKKVLVSPGWIERISWAESSVHTLLTRDAIQTAPEYSGSRPVTRDYEDRLHLHYGRLPYWHSHPGTTH